eukprot:TRINITY_DN22571_c0_g1_i2.p2 TRINITY_DN22571_c0_g1~~TRINITY_DN22571_c0_g1_i2.p2  ORF type:complete len:100 (+),score=2.90 TRINITY_DN22571_c0_g1_i2:928-1227(+)
MTYLNLLYKRCPAQMEVHQAQPGRSRLVRLAGSSQQLVRLSQACWLVVGPNLLIEIKVFYFFFYKLCRNYFGTANFRNVSFFFLLNFSCLGFVSCTGDV